LAEYFEVDPAHVRLLWWALIAVAGLAAGAIAYALVPTVLTILAVAYVVAYLLMSEPPAK
jgi:phage shock protein PspC (stress-responsive transcriptional regulator)